MATVVGTARSILDPREVLLGSGAITRKAPGPAVRRQGREETRLSFPEKEHEMGSRGGYPGKLSLERCVAGQRFFGTRKGGGSAPELAIYCAYYALEAVGVFRRRRNHGPCKPPPRNSGCVGEPRTTIATEVERRSPPLDPAMAGVASSIPCRPLDEGT
jgi:hypothetical protein